jgi:hypothetical protein
MARSSSRTTDSTPASRIRAPVEPNSSNRAPGARSRSAPTSAAACASPDSSPATNIRRKLSPVCSDIRRMIAKE